MRKEWRTVPIHFLTFLRRLRQFPAIQLRLPEKRRSDAVLCIEHLITASPTWDGWGTEKETAFFEQSKKWLENKYGKKNVVSTTVHRDETTPHLVAYVVPVDEESFCFCFMSSFPV